MHPYKEMMEMYKIIWNVSFRTIVTKVYSLVSTPVCLYDMYCHYFIGNVSFLQ
jgi:hypothetical protein